MRFAVAYSTAFILFLFSAIFCHAQFPTANASLAISVPRTSDKVGEAIEATVTLENVGTDDFFICKWLWRNFDIELRDDKERPFCHVVASINCLGVKKKRRGVDTILNEDFFLVSPGDFVGTHWPLRTSCPLLPSSTKLAPGKYHVTVAYDPHANCAPDLSKEHTKFPVLQRTIEGTPVQVELTD